MKTQSLIAAGFIFLCGIAPVWAGDDTGVQRLALCQDSWIDWQKTDPAQMKKFADYFRAKFTPHDNDPYWLPKANISIMGLRATQVFPESIGMAVGFSVTVEAPFDVARRAVERSIGKKVGGCERGDDMQMCGLEIAKERTVTLMAEDSPKAKEALVGCYYLYEK